MFECIIDLVGNFEGRRKKIALFEKLVIVQLWKGCKKVVKGCESTAPKSQEQSDCSD